MVKATAIFVCVVAALLWAIAGKYLMALAFVIVAIAILLILR
ncbi:hypothetical protein [Cupriavidus sp. amp6]|nr:hypothetical protein [Cupriavidus sp. amp6]